MSDEALAAVRRVFEAFRERDAGALKASIAEDAVWTVPGDVPVSRAYLGIDEIMELFRETQRLTGGTYRSELRWALAEPGRAVAVYRASGSRLGRELDIDQVLLIELRDGKWAEIVAVPTDPTAFLAFWAD
jgi:ketosteroid isomerase-like protein